MKYEVVMVFRSKGLNEQYNYKYTQKFVIDDISKLSNAIENTNRSYTIVSIKTELAEDNEFDYYYALSYEFN